MVEGDEELGALEDFFRELVLVKRGGFDEPVVVFVFRVSLENDGPRTFAEGEKAVEGREDGAEQFLVLIVSEDDRPKSRISLRDERSRWKKEGRCR
jgi:hypothetical protein